MTVGDVLNPILLPSCEVGTIDPRQAVAEALAAYLFAARFRRWNGADLREPYTDFQLRAVTREWPEDGTDLVYPCASIVDYGAGAYSASSFSPTVLEETNDKFGPGTVVWKLSELEADFQVDFWTTDLPTREAIAASLPRLFAPGETQDLRLATSERYYNAPCRLSLVSVERMDDEGTAPARERRLRAVVRTVVSVLDLRVARRASLSARIVAIGPGVTVDANEDNERTTGENCP